jgi:hypothetical protein
MNLKLKFKFNSMLVGLLVSIVTVVAAETETACERNDNGAIRIYEIGENPVRDTAGNTGDACKELPDNYRINIFRFGLCTASPYNATNSLDSCSFLINSDAGVLHEIRSSAEAPVSTNSNMAIGPYEHMVLVLENKLGIKHTEEFELDPLVSLGNTEDGKPICGANGCGTKCWTIASTTAFTGQRSGVLQAGVSTPAMDCGDTPVPAYSYEIFDSMGDGGDDAVFTAEDDGGFETASGIMRARLLKADLTSDGNYETATNFENAGYMLVATQFKTAKNITADTTGFEIRFKMTDSVSVDLSYAGDSDLLYAVKNGADPFQIDLIVK